MITFPWINVHNVASFHATLQPNTIFASLPCLAGRRRKSRLVADSISSGLVSSCLAREIAPKSLSKAEELSMSVTL